MGSHKRIPWRRCKIVNLSSDDSNAMNLQFMYPESIACTDRTYVQHKITWDKQDRMRGYYRVLKVNRKSRIVYRADGSAEIQVSDME